MAKIFSEDAYCLGLLYSYLFASKKMVLKDDLDLFYDTIEKNLENTFKKVYIDNIKYNTTPSVGEPKLYYKNINLFYMYF